MSFGSRPAVPTPSSLATLFNWNTMVQTGLFNRILVTLALLGFYRLGVQVPLSGVDQEKMRSILSADLLGFVDLFSGGALSALSVFALGIGPYITASIMMQLLNEIFPALKSLQQEQGDIGRKQYQQITRRFSVLLALLQAFALVKFLDSSGAVTEPSILFYIKSLCSLVAGCLFVMWIGEQISEFGIGNGGSLLIFAGIAAKMPQFVGLTIEAVENGTVPSWGAWTFLFFLLIVIIGIIYLQEGARKFLIVGARAATSADGFGQMRPSSTFLPIKVNPAGVLPIIFAYAALFLPVQIVRFTGNTSISGAFAKLFQSKLLAPIFNPIMNLSPLNKFFELSGQFLDRAFLQATSVEHSILLFIVIITFAFFYSSILLSPKDIAENLQKSGSSIQGVKPGKPTAEYIAKVLNRVVLIGGAALATITIVPMYVEKFCQVTTLSGLGTSSLIIMVGVAIDLYTQMVAYSQAHQYKARTLLG